MKPIHKFNNGRGATLCHKCSVIISVGLTDDLYCKDCRKEMLQDIMKNDEELGLYEKPKQETLEEVAEIFTPQLDKWTIKEIFIAGAKWQMDNQDEFAIGFAEWLVIRYNEDIIYDEYTTKELLEIYKKEKGL